MFWLVVGNLGTRLVTFSCPGILIGYCIVGVRKQDVELFISVVQYLNKFVGEGIKMPLELRKRTVIFALSKVDQLFVS